MLTADCQTFGYPVPILASARGRCGAPTATRLGALAVAGSLLLLVAAIAIAAVVVIRWERLPVAPGDFTWLTKAMAECDAEAEKEPATVHFLVVPMASAPADWGRSLKLSRSRQRRSDAGRIEIKRRPMVHIGDHYVPQPRRQRASADLLHAV